MGGFHGPTDLALFISGGGVAWVGSLLRTIILIMVQRIITWPFVLNLSLSSTLTLRLLGAKIGVATKVANGLGLGLGLDLGVGLQG